ncbi:MAG TPA: phosphoribosylformylglycinamidine synthase subunit PurQ, partial [Candidatus Nitrosotalea sp.]|nr:phosphoribosylformylglycinamidine synthase subunit PurQ [Candidatus Nitrosotalea sp.]
MKVAVIVFPGSNCDRDMHHVLTDVFHLKSQLVWHTDELPKNIDAIVLPGGFSYGDRLR